MSERDPTRRTASGPPVSETVSVHVLRRTPAGTVESRPSYAALRDLLTALQRGTATDERGRPLRAHVTVHLARPGDPWFDGPEAARDDGQRPPEETPTSQVQHNAGAAGSPDLFTSPD